MKVSVVIPCYNVSEFIEECIDSVYTQTYDSIEVICVDNNSSDDTLSKLNKIRQTKYSDLIVLSENSKGAPAARNKGLDKASGEWIQFLDADDLLKPDKIGHQVELLKEAGSNVGFIVGCCEKIDIDSGLKSYPRINTDKFIGPFINEAGNTCANLWSRSELLKIGGWNMKLRSSQEADLMLRLVLSGSEILIDKSIYTVIRTRQAGQISQSDPAGRWRQLIEVRLDFLAQLFVVNHEKHSEHKQTYLNYLMSSILILGRYDPGSATSYYKLVRNMGWQPLTMFGISRIKGILIKFLGVQNYLRVRLFQS